MLEFNLDIYIRIGDISGWLPVLGGWKLTGDNVELTEEQFNAIKEGALSEIRMFTFERLKQCQPIISNTLTVTTPLVKQPALSPTPPTPLTGQ